MCFKNSTSCSIINTIKNKHPELLEGVGKLKNFQVKLHINEDIQPVAQKHRRIPFHLRKTVENEINHLLSQDIIEPTTGPTPWVSPIVIVPKQHDPSKIRMCIDMRAANKAILRERHVTPTIDDIISSINGAKVFSKIDLNQGYHQLVLEPKSRPITTFSTHVGLFRYKRLIFGINAAAEIFQNTIRQVISNITGVINVSDDILIFGKNQQEHNKALYEVLNRLSKHGLTINANKCQFNENSINYFGYVFSSTGVSPDPKKYRHLLTSNNRKINTN